MNDEVAKCDVMLVVIGHQWVNTTDDHGQRRLEKPTDFVRIEVEAALTRNIPVVPVLVQNAQIPHEGDLPPSLAALAYRNGFAVRGDPYFHSDMDLLLGRLDALFDRQHSSPQTRSVEQNAVITVPQDEDDDDDTWEAIVSGDTSAQTDNDVLEIAQRRWADIRKVCKSRSPSVSGLLSSARPVSLESGAPPTIVLQVDFQFHLEQLRDPARRQTVEWALEQILETPVLVRFTLTPESAPNPADGALPAEQTAPKASRLSQSKSDNLFPGDRVVHRLFGPGLVLNVDEVKGRIEVQVLFDTKSAGKKTLDKDFAGLEKL